MPTAPAQGRSSRPALLLRDWAIVTAVLTVAAAGSITLWLMLRVASQAPVDHRVELRLNAIKYGVGIIASGPVLGALLLSLRRQRLAERTQEHTETDATTQRAAELYTRAAEQLGSDKAPVRLAGLYALEQLGQGYAAFRQTVVDLICGYLRMPYAPPDEGELVGSREEDQVRLSAQRLLADHLRGFSPDEDDTQPLEFGPRYWPGLTLNLAGALLREVDFSWCQVNEADFTGAVFVGHAQFIRFTSLVYTHFDHAAFRGKASFNIADLRQSIMFRHTAFEDRADFSGAQFRGLSSFEHAEGAGPVWFRGVRFDGTTHFLGCSRDLRISLGHATAQLDVSYPHSWPPGWETDETGRLIQTPSQPASY